MSENKGGLKFTGSGSGEGYAVKIKVVGIGGGGGNAVNRMVESTVLNENIEFIAINTDGQILTSSKADKVLTIGSKATKGDGAGGHPEVGERAADESKEEIAELLRDADMVVITAGMGGGTGTGAAPVVAKIVRELEAEYHKEILIIGVVTKPFRFEGFRRMKYAEIGIDNLRSCVDSLIVVPNERLKLFSEKKITFVNAFEVADAVLRQGVTSIAELINTPGFINLDFADVKTIMRGAGYAHMGVASAQGKDKASTAASLAISSPLLETSINGAKGLIINITVHPDVEFDEVDKATSYISQQVDPEANIIFGVAFDKNLDDEIKITVVAAGFDVDDELDNGLNIKGDVGRNKLNMDDDLRRNSVRRYNAINSNCVPETDAAYSPGRRSDYNSDAAYHRRADVASDYGISARSAADYNDEDVPNDSVYGPDIANLKEDVPDDFNDFNKILDIFRNKN